MSQLSSGNPSNERSIPQERPKDMYSNQGLIPQSIVEKKIQQQKRNFQEKLIQVAINIPQGNEDNITQTHLEINSQISPITQQHVTIDFQNHDLESKPNAVFRQKSQDDPFSVPELIENEKTAVANHSIECKQEKNSFHSLPKLNILMNDSQGPKIVLSKFAIRKNEYSITNSIQQNGNSNPNKSNNTNSKDEQIYSASQGWMHSQFNPYLDNNLKKEMYVIQKMVEFQFDPVIAKQLIEQIDMEKYSREELIQMVCETMLNHCEEQRVGKRVIDKINQSKFVHKIVSSKTISQVNQSDKSPVAPQQTVQQQNLKPQPKGNTSILHSFNNKNQNIPSNNNILQKDGRERQQNIKQGKKTVQTSYIFNMPITHSQKYIKIENNVQDKDEGKLYTCQICCQEFLGSEFYRLTICSHNFCMQCIQAYIINKINCSEVLNIVCPQVSCGAKIQDLQIQKVISPDLFEKYMRFKKIMVLNQDPNIRWCPTVDCDTYIRGDKDKICLQCPKCNEKMCYLCNSKWHEGSCEDAMNQSLIRMKEKLQIKQCPKCKGRIQKFDGCNHMKCWVCSYEFCWLCKKQYSKWHYRSWNIVGCPDQMFSDEALEGCDKTCLFLSSILRLIFLAVLVLLGGSTALVLYVITMFGMALILPILIACNYFKSTIDQLSDTSKCFIWLVLFALGVFLYPLWLFLCFIPGTCIFGPEIYMYILFLIYNEDMYR
ncbi:Ibr domain protein (macronuclear) [Tetrahymena thermophila SB210]|uniref:RBR-type E3 ubiquitin transferase n=1 Tax=Tetrahymena thermophila (strain SB210) TaxID=312017 RepID=Q23PV0_TETTS|nr:Ibr domain protein [Tetrahymena thermophila SB210]EAR98585.2 Ibr domain protein [Tetrahymena thermophila SB210]|eukprot:XP_001018830.2 Ibr domain protein [Tetrahymena thermophila SB210]